MSWQPTLGDKVRVVTSGRTGAIAHITLTEWGFLYDVEHDDQLRTGEGSRRRTYAAGELAPAPARED